MTSAAREPTSEYSKVHHAADEGWQCMRKAGGGVAGKGNPPDSVLNQRRKGAHRFTGQGGQLKGNEQRGVLPPPGTWSPPVAVEPSYIFGKLFSLKKLFPASWAPLGFLKSLSVSVPLHIL